MARKTGLQEHGPDLGLEPLLACDGRRSGACDSVARQDWKSGKRQDYQGRSGFHQVTLLPRRHERLDLVPPPMIPMLETCSTLWTSSAICYTNFQSLLSSSSEVAMDPGRHEGRIEVEMSRRALLATAAVGLGGAVVPARAGAGAATPDRRPRIAAVGTAYRKMYHLQGIVDRFLDGYGFEGRHHIPGVQVDSLYVDQRGAGDLSGERAARHSGLEVYDSIAGALCRGGRELSVDGVLIIGEQGKYPRNSQGQTLYPRYEFFRQVVEVFRRTGRGVPVFVDKHLSWRWDWAKEMVDTSRALGFPLLAGSSLPVTWRIPSIDVPLGAGLSEVVCVGYGGVDSYDFHGLETLQCMAERRRGGETGVIAVQALRGPAVWKLLAGSGAPGAVPADLFEACLCRSFTLASPRPGYGHAYPSLDDLPRLAPDAYLYRIEYSDGLRGTLLMLSRLVQDFTVAVRQSGEPAILSTQMYLPGLNPGQTLPNFFSPLAHHIETMFLTGKPPYPVDRTLLTTGILAAAVESLAKGQKRIETPHLARLSYQATRESTFLRS
jgi:hypothetical protein